MAPDAESPSRLSLRVAGLTFFLESADPDLRLVASGASERFLVDVASGQATVRMAAALADLTEPPAGELVFDSGGLWRLYREGEEAFEVRCTSPAFGALPYKTARFNGDFTRGEVRLRRDLYAGRPVYPLEYPLDELLMIQLLGAGRGVEVHACGLRDAEGAGLLFVGQSGRGKSTTARLWSEEAGVHILSDDRLILRMEDGTIRMYGTPWHGEQGLAMAASAPLRAVFFLEHGRRNRLAAVPGPQAVARLLAASFPPFHNRAGVAFTLELLEQVVGAVPCREFAFVPGAGAVAAARAAVRSEEAG